MMLACLLCLTGAATTPAIARGITARELGVLINVDDPQSVAVAAYYQQRRHIPDENLIRVKLPKGRESLSVSAFHALKADIDRRTPRHVQAYAVTWVAPYRVACVSLNTALAMGYDPSRCERKCRLTRRSPYYDSASRAPAANMGIRPVMSIAARSLAEARALIDRGVASDGTQPAGSAYLLSTSDAARNVRAARYGLARMTLGSVLQMQVLQQDVLRDRQDVMFYFTGLPTVPDITTNRFLPGGVADHLTSYGGDLLGKRQMSVLDWIGAGATGSYGTVAEPCSFPAKFPDVPVMMRRYLDGDTLIEAYWKSVLMPGEGIFVGEPLARPWPARR